MFLSSCKNQPSELVPFIVCSSRLCVSLAHTQTVSVTCLTACGTVPRYRPSAGLIFIKAISAALDVSRAHRHSKSIPADRHRLPQPISIPFRAALKVSSGVSALHSHLQLLMTHTLWSHGQMMLIALFTIYSIRKLMLFWYIYSPVVTSVNQSIIFFIFSV